MHSITYSYTIFFQAMDTFASAANVSRASSRVNAARAELEGKLARKQSESDSRRAVREDQLIRKEAEAHAAERRLLKEEGALEIQRRAAAERQCKQNFDKGTGDAEEDAWRMPECRCQFSAKDIRRAENVASLWVRRRPLWISEPAAIRGPIVIEDNKCA